MQSNIVYIFSADTLKISLGTTDGIILFIAYCLRRFLVRY